MTNVFGALEQLFIHSIPTVIFVIILFFVLEHIFFRPVAEVMKKRAAATVGAMEWARKQAGAAEQKSREHDAAMQAARLEIYSTRQNDRQSALAEREARLRAARERSEGLVKEAQNSIAAESAAAKEQLAAVSQSLAREITEKILSEDFAPGGEGVQ